jgi:hypothetical protein
VPQPAALAAAAFSGVIELSDLAYTVETCPAGFFLPERARCKCLHVTATAKNGLKSAVEAASVFGFITDVNGDSAAAVRHSAKRSALMRCADTLSALPSRALQVNANGNSRTVLAPIVKPVPLGTSCVEFEVAVFEDSLNAGPLKLKGFKATPSLAAVEERFKTFGACELDATAEGCDGAV